MRHSDPDLPGPRAKTMLYRRFAAGILGVGLSVALWHLLSVMIGSSLIFPGPAEVVGGLRTLLASPSFWKAVIGSMERVLLSFILSIGIGTLTGISSGLNPWIRDSLAPLITTIRATPVLALILVAMFWLPSTGVPIFSAFLMAYPIMHTSAYTGVVLADKDLLEMASVFKVPPK